MTCARQIRAAIAAFLLLLPGAGATAQGLIREPDEVYRSYPAVLRFRGFLPPEVDLSGAFPQPGAQGAQASCTGWAVGYALRSYYERQRRGWDLADPHHVFSPAFVYNQLAAGDATCKRGTAISDALNLLRERGAVSLADFPYDPQQCRAVPSPEQRAAAAPFRIAEWHRIDNRQLDDVKGQLRLGNPVVFGIDVSAGFEKLKAGEIYDDLAAPRTLAHAMVVVGYSESRQAFKVINSWGPSWGDQGFGWISYRTFERFADRAFVATVSDLPAADKLLANARPISVRVDPPLASAAPPAAKAVAGTRPAEVLGRFQCAKLATVEDTAGPRIEGFVASEADRVQLREALGERFTTDRVAVRPWPGCEALLTFDRELGASHGLSVTVADEQKLLHEGGTLIVDVVSPDFPSYLYVTYLQASGEAVHLRQPAPLGRALPPHTRLRIGGGGADQPQLRVSPPFGDEMVIVMAAASPLFATERPASETERDYLTAWRAALLARSATGHGGRLAAAAVVSVRTAPP